MAKRKCNLSEGIYNDGVKDGTISMVKKMLEHGISPQELIVDYGCSEEDVAAAQAEAPKAEN